MSKSIFKSKLFWLGAVQVAIGVLDLVKVNVLDATEAAWGAVIIGAATIVLRVLTNQPVKLR